jgi:surface carbohydrate biosynthesis protein
MLIYLHIDELSRDAIFASSLRDALKIKNNKIIYGNRIITKILLPFFYDYFSYIIVPRTAFIDFKKIKNTNNIIILPTECVGRLNSSEKFILHNILGEKFMLNDNSEVQKVKFFFVWGPIQKSVISKKYPELEKKIITIGHPRLDNRCLPTFESQSKNKLHIGIVSRMTHLNSYDSRSVIKHFEIYNNEPYIYYKDENTFLSNPYHEGFKDLLYVEASDYYHTLLVISELLKKENIVIHFKVHPRENIYTWEAHFKKEILDGKFIITNWTYPFIKWCEKLNYIISPSSTSFYEALSINKSVICIDNLDKYRNIHDISPSDHEFGLMKYLNKPNSIDELVAIIVENKEIISEENKKLLEEQLFEEINFPNCFNSSSNIVECLSVNNTFNHNILFVKIFKWTSFILNYLIYFKRLLLGIKTQSNSFLLTHKTVKFINKLFIEIEE